MPARVRPLPGLLGAGRRARWRRSVIRRLLAVACAAAALLLVAHEVRPPPPPMLTVVVAASAVPAGSVLGSGDVHLARVPRDTAQPGSLTSLADALDRRAAAALAPGETVTRTRLVPRSAAEGLAAGQVALHVVLADPLAAGVVRPGQPVLVFAATGGTALARHAVVLAVDPTGRTGPSPLGETAARGVVLGLPGEEAERVLAGHGGLEGPVVVNLVAAGT